MVRGWPVLLPVQRPGRGQAPPGRALNKSRSKNSLVVPILAAETDQFSPDFPKKPIIYGSLLFSPSHQQARR